MNWAWTPSMWSLRNSLKIGKTLMAAITLPTDLIVRPAQRNDAQVIADINAEQERAWTGTSESTVSDVLELWDTEHTVLATDTLVITTQNGELVGYTGVVTTTRGIMLDVHTTVQSAYQDQAILLAYLHQFAEERAQALCTNDPALPRQLYTWSFTPTTRHTLEQRGYTIESSDSRMEITFKEPPAPPTSLQDITVRPFIKGQEERAVYDVIAEAFPDIDGKPYRPFDEWYEHMFEKSTSFDPSMLYVALAEKQIVGTILCRIYPENHDGYIWQLAVRRAWRKHGIARQLLFTVFAEFYRRGMHHVELSVDTENSTGAHQLYTNVGMTKRIQVDEMVKML